MWFNPNRYVSPEEDGYVMRDVQVVKFHDTNTSGKWFARDFETLGYVSHPFDGPVPFDEKELLDFVKKTYGEEAYAIY